MSRRVAWKNLTLYFDEHLPYVFVITIHFFFVYVTLLLGRLDVFTLDILALGLTISITKYVRGRNLQVGSAFKRTNWDTGAKDSSI